MICDHDTQTCIQKILTWNLNTYACNYLTFTYVIETFMHIIKNMYMCEQKVLFTKFELKKFNLNVFETK